MNIFEGIRVIEFASNLAGPYPAALMADFGADVIKIESPGQGDNCRTFNPQVEGASTMFHFLNRGKKSVELNLKSPEGVNAAKRLVEKADVVIESNKPGVMERYGLSFEKLKALKADIIMCRVSAFGQTGPEKDRPGHDLMAQAESGAMDVTGEAAGPPVKHGFALSAYMAGTYAFGAISAALFHRERTGEGQCIDISLFDSLFSINDYVEPAALGIPATRTGQHHTLLAPFGVYDGKDGSLALAALTPKAWQLLCKITGREDMLADQRLATSGSRMDHINEVTNMIETWLHGFERVDEAVNLLRNAGVPCSKILSTEALLTHEQLLAREMIIKRPAGDKEIISRANPLKFSLVRPEIKRAPRPGEHQHEVFGALGYTAEELARLKG